VLGVTSKVGELNTIVGDAAGTISKYKAEYGDDLESSMAAAKKAKDRMDDATKMYAEYQDEIKERKEQYDALLDTVAPSRDYGYDDDYDDYNYEWTEEELAREEERIAAINRVQLTDPNALERADAESLTDAQGRVTSDLKRYDDGSTGAQRGLAPASAADLMAVDEGSNLREAVAGNLQRAEVSEAASAPQGFRTSPVLQNQAAPATRAAPAAVQAAPAERAAQPVPAAVQVAPATRAAQPTPAAIQAAPSAVQSAPAALQREQAVPVERTLQPAPATLQTAPAAGRVSSSTRSGSHAATFAFVTLAGKAETGNSYINDIYVAPLAKLCGVNAEDYIKDEKIRQKCSEKIIRDNAATNQFDAANAQKDCRRMVFEATMALLAEATLLKGEAANYGEQAQKQDIFAATSTDTRDDTHVLADTSMKTQELLNKIASISASELLLRTAEQICATPLSVLGSEDAEADGGK